MKVLKDVQQKNRRFDKSNAFYSNRSKSSAEILEEIKSIEEKLFMQESLFT